MPHPIDAEVGKRIRARRQSQGLTQVDLAKAIGVKFQQVQKYETAMNRVSASRLVDIAKALNTEHAYFFEGFTGDHEADLQSPDERSLITAYRATTPETQRSIRNIAREAAQAVA